MESFRCQSVTCKNCLRKKKLPDLIVLLHDQVFYSEVTDLIKPRHLNKRKLTVKMDEKNGVVTVDNATKLYFEWDEI
jgi:hypothetical protein